MEEQKTKSKRLPKLTKKQRGFVNDYVKDENGTQAALKNYDTKDYFTANAIAVENLQKPIIQEAIEVKRRSLKEALIAQGITEDYLAEKVNVLLTAVDDKGYTDYTAVDKGLKHATSIYGVQDIDKPKENVYNFFFEPKFQQNIKNYDQNLKDQLLNRDDEENK